MISLRSPMRRAAAALTAAALTACLVGPAGAGEIVPISMAAYQAAAAKGKPIVFHVKADWCPVCAKQSPIIAKLMKEPAYANYTVLVVDFDKDKNALQMLHVDHQSTLVVNKGPTEVARATGMTDESQLRALLNKTE